MPFFTVDGIEEYEQDTCQVAYLTITNHHHRDCAMQQLLHQDDTYQLRKYPSRETCSQDRKIWAKDCHPEDSSNAVESLVP